jgi:hypothetical protein
MSCSTPNCSGTATAGSGANVVNTPARTCSGETFCDDKLEGLPFSTGVDLVGVPEGDKCLHRVNSPKGIWQHDPSRAGGSDFVGPLEAGLSFQPGENMTEDECGHLPVLRDVTPAGAAKPVLELVKQDVTEVVAGELAIITKCKGGKVRTDILAPVAYDDANPCEANLSLLGFVTQVVIEGSKQVTRKVWKALTKIVLPDTQVSKFSSVDLTDGTNWRNVVVKKRGNCWELGLAPAEAAESNDCSTYDSVGATFGYLLACDGGTLKKVEPQNGMALVGNGSAWELKPLGLTRLSARHFIGSEHAGHSGTGDIAGRVDTIGTTAGSQSGTFNMLTTLGASGYVTGRKIAWVRALAHVGIGGAGTEALAQVIVNGEVIQEAWADDGNDFAYRCVGVYPVALTNDQFTFDLNTSVDNTSACQAFSKLEVVGWE